jgi:uncharacterized protein YndB with AHSA1/START domain
MTTTQQSTQGGTRETRIEAPPGVPTIVIEREFDAEPARVFHAWSDGEQFARWSGPRSVTTTVPLWNARTGGSYRFANHRDGEEIASFYGSFHEVRPDERIVWTFTWEGMPDGVSLETITFEPLPGGRTRVRSTSLVDSFEARDGMLASGMETGVVEGYDKLDELLAQG